MLNAAIALLNAWLLWVPGWYWLNAFGALLCVHSMCVARKHL